MSILKSMLNSLQLKDTTPELRLTCTGSDYMRQVRTATTNYGYQYNRVSVQGSTVGVNVSGTTMNINVADNAAFSFTSGGGVDTAFSFHAWVNFNSLSGANGIVSKSDASAAAEYEFFRYTDGKLYLRLYSAGGRTVWIGRTAPWTPTTGIWYSVGFSYSGSKANSGCKLYVNGSPVDNADGSLGSYAGMADTAQPLYLAALGAPASVSSLRGVIDETAIWGRELSGAEFTALYNSGVGVYGNITQAPFNSGLVAGWHLDDNTGTNAADFSGNGRNGTLTNSPTWTTGKVPGTASIQEATIFSSKDGTTPAEKGIQTFGDATGQTNINYGTTSNIISNATTVGNWTSGGLFSIGATAGTGHLNIINSSDIVGLKIVANATQTSHLMDIFASDGTTARFHIDGTGLVGIGTVVPTSILHLNSASTTGTALKIDNLDTGGHKYRFLSTGSGNTGGAGAFTIYDDSNGNVFYISNTGNIGIGTAYPNQKLYVGDLRANNPTICVRQTDAGSTYGMFIAVSDANLGKISGSGSGSIPVAFFTGNTEVFRYTTTGLVGIGTTVPGAKLSIAAGINNVDSEVIRFQRTEDENRYNSIYSLSSSTAGSSTMSFKIHDGLGNTSQATVMTLKGSGNVGIGTTSPTATLHLKAGTAAASTAPLKFSAGPLTTVIENGTHEYDGDFHYLTSGTPNGTLDRRRVVTANRVCSYNDESVYMDDSLILV